jgi:glutamine cyclotransferase
MKKSVIIGLIAIVGISFLIIPLFNSDEDPFPKKQRLAEFSFKGQLAVQAGEEIEIGIKVNVDGLKEIQVIFDDSLLHSWNNPKEDLTFKYDFNVLKVGAKSISIRTKDAQGKTSVEDGRIIRVLSDIDPTPMIVEVVSKLPHSDTCFTQGLEFYKGVLYEGSGDEGNLGKTVLGARDMTTGEFTKKTGIGRPYFGEGITILDGLIYQLTWRNGKCFVYDIENLNIKSEFNYTGEGWGLCNDGKYLIMSDGSERIFFRDPKTFQLKNTIEVYNNTTAVHSLNELEYIDGLIYANVYLTDGIVVIDPKSGKVLKEINASNLTQDVITSVAAGEVLNGIAYNDEDNKLYLTGKNWPRLFEVNLKEKQ